MTLEPEEDQQFSFGSFRINALSVPIAIAIALLTKATYVFDMLSHLIFTIPAHELGHASMAWLTGRMAIPIGFLIPMAGFTSFFENRSVIVFIIFASICTYCAFLSYQKQRSFPLWISVGLMLLSTYLNFKITDEQSLNYAIYAGIGGEFVIGAFLMIAFYYPGIPGIRWDFFRFPVLLWGTGAFVRAYWQWLDISKGLRAMPMGSFLDGSDSQDGDLQRLISPGWTPQDLTQSYLRLGKVCLFVVAAHYVYFLLQSRKKPVV